MSRVEWIVSHDVREGLERHGDAGMWRRGEGELFDLPVVIEIRNGFDKVRD